MGETRQIRLQALTLMDLVTCVAQRGVPARVEFNRDVRPILSDNCFLCHGPDKNHRKADLRLDLRDEALEAEAIVPGKPDESALVARILSDRRRRADAPAEVEQDSSTPGRRRSSGAGSRRGPNISNTGPTSSRSRPQIPDRASNAVDVLVRRRLAEVGLKPSPEADRRTLIRRLYFDLTGLPPTPEEVEAFVDDTLAGRLRAPGRAPAGQPALRRADGASAGSTWSGSPTRSATTATTPATSGPTATGSSRASTTTSPSTASPSSSSPATCCPTRRRRPASARRSTACCSPPRKGARRRRTTRPAC